MGSKLELAGVWAVLAVLPATIHGAPPDAAPTPRSAAALAAFIDEQITAGWQANKVEPAPVADDAEFLRRVYLDLIGRIPGVTEARTFLEDRRPDKRQRLIQQLLDSQTHVNHFTNVWRDLLLPELMASIQNRAIGQGFDIWVRNQLVKNIPYDQMVRELLTTKLQPQVGRLAVIRGQQGQANPGAFFQLKELKPENLAAATSRLFLGVRLECAQCHNHPFAQWKREQFWQLAAFYSGMRSSQQNGFAFLEGEDQARRQIPIPGTERTVQATFLDGTKPVWQDGEVSREKLAAWVTSPENPYFARATVNRLWAHLLGRGLADPIDEMVGDAAEVTHPELLDQLAREFIAHRFDLHYLLEAITSSKTYQLSSVLSHPTQEEPKHFARASVRALTAAQLFDSLVQATGFQEGGQPRPGQVVLAFGRGGVREEFLTRFASHGESPTEVQTSILQALSLMNGSLMASATSLERSETLGAILDAPFLDTPGRIEALYLAGLARKPNAREIDRVTRYIDRRIETGDASSANRQVHYNQAVADVFWAILNSGEFYLNH
jgi:hypothetical protein